MKTEALVCVCILCTAQVKAKRWYKRMRQWKRNTISLWSIDKENNDLYENELNTNAPSYSQVALLSCTLCICTQIFCTPNSLCTLHTLLYMFSCIQHSKLTTLLFYIIFLAHELDNSLMNTTNISTMKSVMKQLYRKYLHQ